MLSIVDRWLSRVEGLFAALAVVGLLFITFSVCLEIVLRTFFNWPLQWVIELTEYTLLYITFLGSSWLLRRNGHVSVDVLVLAVNTAWRRRLGLVSAALGLAIAVLLTYFGVTITVEHMYRGTYKPTVLEFPTWLVLMAIPIGSAALTLRFLYRWLVLWTRADEPRPETS